MTMCVHVGTTEAHYSLIEYEVGAKQHEHAKFVTLTLVPWGRH